MATAAAGASSLTAAHLTAADDEYNAGCKLQAAAISRHGAKAMLATPYFARDPDIATAVASSSAVADALPLTRVYYLPRYIDTALLPRLLTDIPAVAVSGDRHIVLQDGEHVGAYGVQLPDCITWSERRRGRKKVIISYDQVYAYGGYPSARSRATKYPSPFGAVMVTVAGAQFEMRYLEAQHFIIAPDESVPEDLEPFLHYYPIDHSRPYSGRKPTWYEASTNEDDPNILTVPFTSINDDAGRATYLHVAAYENSVAEDMQLLFAALDDWMSSAATAGVGVTKIWIQLPAVGLGFFAEYLGRYSLASLLRPAFLSGVQRALSSRRWEHIAVLELLDFTRDGSFCLRTSSVGDIQVVHGRRSLLDFSDKEREQYTLAAVNAGDAFAFAGNEHGYGSVEAMLGENTSIRRTQVYLHNAWMLRRSHWKAVEP